MLCIAALALALPAAPLPQSRAGQRPPTVQRPVQRPAERPVQRAATRPAPRVTPARVDPRQRYVDEPLQELCSKLDLTPATRRRVETILQHNMRVASVRSSTGRPTTDRAPAGRTNRPAAKSSRQPRTPVGGSVARTAPVQLRGLGGLPGTVIRDIKAVIPPEKDAAFRAMLSHHQWSELRQIDQRYAAVQRQERQAAAKQRKGPPAVGPPPSLGRPVKSSKSSNWSTKWTSQRNTGRGGRGGGGGRGGRGGGRGGGGGGGGGWR